MTYSHTNATSWHRAAGILVVVLTLFLSACSTQYINRGKGEAVTNNTLVPQVVFQVHDAFDKHSPKCVAILPIEGDGGDERVDLVRRALYAHLSPRGFRDVELARIDYVIKQNGFDVTSESNRAALGEKIHCDAFIIGEVMDKGQSFYGIYSKVEAGAKLKMVRAVDGEILWEAEHQAKLQDGGLPLSPIGLAAGLFNAAANIEEEQTLRVIDDLARRVTSTIPNVLVDYSDDEKLYSLFSASESAWEGDMDEYLSSSSAGGQELLLRQLLRNHPLSEHHKEQVYQRLTAISGKSVDYRLWGEDRFQRGDYEGALELFVEAAEKNPSDAEAWYLQGRVLTRLDRLEEADERLVNAVAHNPDRDDYYAALGYLNSRRGNLDRAKAAYQMALDRNPENGFAWYNLAVSDYNNGNLRDATEYFYNAGRFYLRQKRFDRVEQVVLDLGDLQKRRNGSKTIAGYIHSLKQGMDEQAGSNN